MDAQSPKIGWTSRLGGCEISIAEKSPSPGGNLPSDRYLTRWFLLPTACMAILYRIFKKKQEIFYNLEHCKAALL